MTFWNIKRAVVRLAFILFAAQRGHTVLLKNWNVKKSESILKNAGKTAWSLPNHEQSSLSLALTGHCKLMVIGIQLFGMCVCMCLLIDSSPVMDSWISQWILVSLCSHSLPGCFTLETLFSLCFSSLTHLFPYLLFACFSSNLSTMCIDIDNTFTHIFTLHWRWAANVFTHGKMTDLENFICHLIFFNVIYSFRILPYLSLRFFLSLTILQLTIKPQLHHNYHKKIKNSKITLNTNSENTDQVLYI